MHRRIAVGKCLLVLALAGLSGGCRRTPESPVAEPRAAAPAPRLSTIRAGYLPTHAFLPLFVAMHDKTFARYGLNVTASRFESSPAMGSAFLNGDLDAIPISTAVALTTESRDPGRFRIVAVSAEDTKGYLTAIVVGKGSNVKSVGDLRGKRVGAFPGPAALTLFGLVFEKHGLKPGKDVTLVEIPPPLQIQALGSGQVAALATYEPIATQAVVEHGATMLVPAAVETYVLNPTHGGLWLISTETLHTRPREAHAYILGLYDAIARIDRNPQTTTTAAQQYVSVKPEILRRLPVIKVTTPPNISASGLQRFADLMFERKVISRRIDVQPLLMTRAEIESLATR